MAIATHRAGQRHHTPHLPPSPVAATAVMISLIGPAALQLLLLWLLHLQLLGALVP